MRQPPEADTVLADVLAAHGRQCRCTGTCGRTHPAGTCDAEPYGRIIAAPAVPHATDHENAAAPPDMLRPWCGPCWMRALGLARAHRAAQLQKELADHQIGLFEL